MSLNLLTGAHVCPTNAAFLLLAQIPIRFYPLRHNTGPVLEVLTKEFSLVADRSSLGGGERDNVMEIKTKVS